MTRFQKKEQDALAAFQKEMNQFGLYVNTRVFGGMYSDDEKYFCLEAGTNAQPVKGNKALIEKIKAAGYIVVKSRQTDETGRNVYVFWVMKIYRILREENDAQEYTEKPPRTVPAGDRQDLRQPRWRPVPVPVEQPARRRLHWGHLHQCEKRVEVPGCGNPAV